MTQRWLAAIAAQRIWRGFAARKKVQSLLKHRKFLIQERFTSSNRFEASLLIQCLFRQFLARKRLQAVRELAVIARTIKPLPTEELFSVDSLPPSIFQFAMPPHSLQLRNLFDAIDTTRRGVVSEKYCHQLWLRYSLGELINTAAVHEAPNKVASKQQCRRLLESLVCGSSRVAQRSKDPNYEFLLNFDQFCVFILRLVVL